MTLERLIEQKAFQTMTGHMIMVDDILAWAIEQMEQGNLLPGATKENTNER
jgi:hypothetical protein